MGLIARTDFTRGWVPSADAVNAPAGSLLRMDNCVLDERGAVTLRKGSAKINSSAFADTDVHSLFTVNLGTTRYRMAGATSAVYANGTSIASSINSSGDIAFGSYLGQIMFARGTTKKKYDGSTVRNWGIAAPNAAPTLAVIAADSQVFATFDLADAAGLAVNEDDSTGETYTAGFDGTADGALILNPNATTGRGRATYTYGSPTDFSIYDGSQVGTDDDTIELWMYVTDPNLLNVLTIRIDVNDGTYKDMYGYIFRFQSEFQEENTPVAVGWNNLQIRRGDMIRSAGATAGKNWSTVKAVQVEVLCTVGTSTSQIRFDRWRIIGGAQRPLTGIKRYKLVAVYNSGTYTALSAPSDASADIETTAQGVTVTIPSGVVSALDSQVNEVWAYRYSDELGDYYRIGTKTGGPWVGAQTISDTTSDETALATNIKLQPNNTTPPDSIIGIVGPHYDRLLTLTATHLYASQPRNLDSFDSTHAIRVGDGSETALWVAKVREEVYVGTTRDIYRIDGDWTERADGLINVSKRPTGQGAPPISSAIAQDGDTLIYLTSDGWRAYGAPAAFTAGDVDLLYRGYTRHGVSPVNLTGGRFKAALCKGVFTAITPEGASTTSSAVLHRYVPSAQKWYRHTYGSQAWRCIYREPDGTLIASDSAGFVWTLDTGTQDASSDIAVVLWTPVDLDGRPHQRKDPFEARFRADTGGASATANLHLEGSSTATDDFEIDLNGLGVTQVSLGDVGPFLSYQWRVTGSFSTFNWYDYHIGAHDLPIQVRGRIPDSNAGTPKPKMITGMRIRMCTLGAAVTITPIVDNAELTTEAFTTSLSQPDECVISFSTTQLATDVAFSASGPIELYDWAPLVDAVLPIGRTLWDSGPIDLGQRVSWIIGAEVKAKLTADLTITPYIDDVPLTAQTIAYSAATPITTYTVSLTRPVRGRQPRFVCSSTSDFHLYWIQPNYRLTGGASDLKSRRVETAI